MLVSLQKMCRKQQQIINMTHYPQKMIYNHHFHLYDIIMQTCSLILSHPVAARKTAFRDLDTYMSASLAESPTASQQHTNHQPATYGNTAEMILKPWLANSRSVPYSDRYKR